MSCRGRIARRISEGRTDIGQFGGKRGKGEIVGGRARANHQVDGRERRQELNSHDFSEASLELVAIHGGMAVSRNDDPDSWMPERGSKISEVEVSTPDSLPPSNDGFQVALSRQSKLAREANAVIRRRRTCSAGARSEACAPFSVDDSEPDAPIWWPCARGTHEYECGACCGDGMWACPSKTYSKCGDHRAD